MNNIAIKSMDDYMMSLSINTRKEKVKDFLRFKDSSNFFEFDEADEILETKNTWAGYAYLIMLETIEGKQISEREEEFLEQYFQNYLLTTKTIGLENELKGFYLKYRVSKHFEEKLKEANHEAEEEISLEEFRITIEALINEMYHTNFNLVMTKDRLYFVKSPIVLLAKNNEIIIDERYLSDVYSGYRLDNCNPERVFALIENIAKKIELNELNEVKRHGINKKAVIYTVEDYLESKASKKTRLGDIYKDLYQDIIANKQIFIDSSLNAYNKLKGLQEKLKASSYPYIDNVLDIYLNDRKNDIDELVHYYADARFFDTTNLEEDAFAKIYDMYIKGLKAMPKSQLTDVTKYFVVNGCSLTTLDMDAIISKYETKLSREKNEEKKAILEEKLNNIKEVIDFVKSQSYSYELEEEIRTFIDKRECVTNDVREKIKENHTDLVVLINRVMSAIEHTEQLASSGSASKVKHIMEKKAKLQELLYTCIDLECDLEVDLDRDIVIERVNNEYKAIAMLQELTGNNVYECKRMLDMATSNGEPLIRDLNPGFKRFATRALELKGVRTVKSK